MGKFTKIPADTFDTLQLDAGVLLNTFNPETPTEPTDETIICATTGGINPTCIPTYSDMGEDVDNCPNNMKELKKLDSWECKIAFTAIAASPEVIQLALGAADISTNKITPRRSVKLTDFKDIWGKYFFYYFSTKFYDRAMKMTAKATVDSVRLEMISEMDIKKPPQISEQKQIAEFFAHLDNLITLHQRKLEKIQKIKQGMMQQLLTGKIRLV